MTTFNIVVTLFVGFFIGGTTLFAVAWFLESRNTGLSKDKTNALKVVLAEWNSVELPDNEALQLIDKIFNTK